MRGRPAALASAAMPQKMPDAKATALNKVLWKMFFAKFRTPTLTQLGR